MSSFKQEIETKITEANLGYVWVDKGVGYRLGNVVYLNENLLKYPEFCKRTVNHEIRHTSGYAKKDFVMDMLEPSLWDTLKFCFKHPKGFYGFNPIEYENGKWYIDINLLIVYTIFITTLIILWLILKRNIIS